MAEFQIKITTDVTLPVLRDFLNDPKPTVVLSAEAKNAIVHCREFLEKKMESNQSPIYGINTGFGSLCNVVVAPNELEKLQENLIKSHACGMGEKLDSSLVKLMLFLKVQSLAYGKSGVQLSTVERLIDFINLGIYPVVYEQGSLGASGDLAPLAHLCLPLIGEGKVEYQNEVQEAKEILTKLNLQALRLKSKEGLALLNGTQFMSALGVYCLIQSRKMSDWADFTAAVSLDGFDGKSDPFNPQLHQIRPHPGQVKTATQMLQWLTGSEITAQEKKQVQDPYSFRCIPQVHGASKDTIAYAEKVFETEINAVTDNPTIFPETGEIISGGNFHGQPLALALDFLAIALSELASISERRIYLLISGQRGLPPFLIKEAGLHSGFMIPQYTAASIVSQNKQLCTPASIDSIVSSNGQEDHVSMGANAATKCLRVTHNVHRVLAIELLCAMQALDFRRPKKSSETIERVYSDFRKLVKFVEKDVYMHQYMKNAEEFIDQNLVPVT